MFNIRFPSAKALRRQAAPHKPSFYLGLCLAALLLAIPSHAQTSLCVPQGTGVPFGGVLHPMWWDSSDPGNRNRIDDPRWDGSLARSFGGHGTEYNHVLFRALRDETPSALYLSWHVKVDPILNPDGVDFVAVAFSPGPGKADKLFRIRTYDYGGGPVVDLEAQPPAQFETWVRSGLGSFELQADNPDWLGSAGTPYTAVWVYPAGNLTWAIHMRVPIAAGDDDGIPLDDEFRMWFEVRVAGAGEGYAPYRLPDGLTFHQVRDGNNAPMWAKYRRDVPVTDGDCIRDVSIRPQDIGSDYPGDSHKIRWKDDDGRPATNVMHAWPLNESGGDIGVGGIRAVFRIANWGTQPWLPDAPPAPWTQISPDPPPATTAVTHNTDQATIEFPWHLTREDVCDFEPDYVDPDDATFECPNSEVIKWDDQCLLVELDGDPGLTFAPSSVFRNMRFVEASKFQGRAMVSVQGLGAPPSGGAQRDVYLYVQTFNMPREVPKQRGDRQLKSAAADLGSMPTYVVHAYHDTGKGVVEDGVTYRELQPQTSFGYYVRHEGDLEGWRHRLEGQNLVELAPNYYKIPAPVDGFTTVETTIVAKERSGFSLSLHAGVNDPGGVAGSLLNGGFSAGLDLEYRFDDHWAAELFLGHDTFDGPAGGSFDLTHLSFNGKYYFAGSWARPFVLAGVGAYDPDAGSTEFGYNLGAGFELELWPSAALSFTARRHTVDLSGPDFEFLTYHTGVRIYF